MEIVDSLFRSRAPGPPTDLPYRVRTLGRNRGNRYHSTAGTFHDDCMLTVVLAGRGRYLLDGVAVSIRRGHVGLVIGDGRSPGLLMADPTEPYDHLYCRFTGTHAQAVARRLHQRFGRRFVLHEAWQDVADVLLRAMALGRVPATTAPERLTRHDAALAEALAVLDAPPADDARRLTAERLRTYMENRLSQAADLAAAARHFAVSKSHLCRQSRRLLGEPMHQAWERMKMEWAQILLREPTLRIGEVAARVGYRDPLYFSKAFRKCVGESPTDFRRRG